MPMTPDELKRTILEIKEFCANQKSCKICPLRTSDIPTCFVEKDSWECCVPYGWDTDWSDERNENA